MSEAYVPSPGDRVMVERWAQPTLTPGDPLRALKYRYAGVVAWTDPEGMLGLDNGECIDLGYVFLDPDYLVTEVTPLDAGFRLQLGADLAVVVDASQCVVLDVMHPHSGITLQRVTVTDVGRLKTALDHARSFQRAVLADADARRLAGTDERRAAEGKLSRREAAEEIMSHGIDRMQAADMILRALQVGESLPVGGADGTVTASFLGRGLFSVAFEPRAEASP